MEIMIENLRELIYLGTVSFYLIIVLIVLSCITVSLRLWVRCRITKSPGWDDAAMVATLILFICFCAFVLAILHRSGQGRTFQPEALRMTLMFIQLSEVFYVLTTTLLKISLGLFFLHVLTKRWQVRIFHTIICVSAIYGLFYVSIVIFRCGEPSRLANSVLAPAKCLPSRFVLITGYVYGVINMVADFTFVLLPITVLLDSDLDRKSKISVSLIMGLGAAGSVASVMRMVYLQGLALGTKGLSPTTVKATIWATAEPGTGIIAASIATLRPLFRKIASDVRTKTVYHYGSRKYTTTRPEDGDSIALTSRSTKNPSLYSIGSAEPWSPTAVVGQANMTRVISVQMINGRGSSLPSGSMTEGKAQT